jgi:integrase
MATIRKIRGKWQAIIRKKNHPHIAKTFISKHEADRWARESELKIERGIFRDLDEAHRTTLKELLQRYADEVSVKKKSAKNERYKIGKLCRMNIAKTTLAKLTSTKIAKFRDALVLDVKPATVNKYLTYIQTSINHARREWDLYLPINPVEKIKRFKEPEPIDERVEKHEYVLLIKEAERSKLKCLKNLIMIAYETGARWGEIVKLKQSDVNFNRGIAHLRDTKNGLDRWIGLSPIAITILKACPIAPDGRYFPTHKDQFKFYWNQLKRWTGYKKRFHTFRAEFATRMFEQGWDISAVATQGGWKEWKVLRRYTRLKPDYLTKKLAVNGDDTPPEFTPPDTNIAILPVPKKDETAH